MRRCGTLSLSHLVLVLVPAHLQQSVGGFHDKTAHPFCPDDSGGAIARKGFARAATRSRAQRVRIPAASGGDGAPIGPSAIVISPSLHQGALLDGRCRGSPVVCAETSRRASPVVRSSRPRIFSFAMSLSATMTYGREAGLSKREKETSKHLVLLRLLPLDPKTDSTIRHAQSCCCAYLG